MKMAWFIFILFIYCWDGSWGWPSIDLYTGSGSLAIIQWFHLSPQKILNHYSAKWETCTEMLFLLMLKTWLASIIKIFVVNFFFFNVYGWVSFNIISILSFRKSLGFLKHHKKTDIWPMTAIKFDSLTRNVSSRPVKFWGGMGWKFYQGQIFTFLCSFFMIEIALGLFLICHYSLWLCFSVGV